MIALCVFGGMTAFVIVGYVMSIRKNSGGFSTIDRVSSQAKDVK